MPVSATFSTPDGRTEGLLLFVADGRMASLEVYGYEDPPPIVMPEASWLEDISA